MKVLEVQNANPTNLTYSGRGLVLESQTCNDDPQKKDCMLLAKCRGTQLSRTLKNVWFSYLKESLFLEISWNWPFYICSFGLENFEKCAPASFFQQFPTELYRNRGCGYLFASPSKSAYEGQLWIISVSPIFSSKIPNFSEIILGEKGRGGRVRPLWGNRFHRNPRSGWGHRIQVGRIFAIRWFSVPGHWFFRAKKGQNFKISLDPDFYDENSTSVIFFSHFLGSLIYDTFFFTNFHWYFWSLRKNHFSVDFLSMSFLRNTLKNNNSRSAIEWHIFSHSHTTFGSRAESRKDTSSTRITRISSFWESLGAIWIGWLLAFFSNFRCDIFLKIWCHRINHSFITFMEYRRNLKYRNLEVRFSLIWISFFLFGRNCLFYRKIEVSFVDSDSDKRIKVSFKDESWDFENCSTSEFWSKNELKGQKFNFSNLRERGGVEGVDRSELVIWCSLIVC